VHTRLSAYKVCCLATPKIGTPDRLSIAAALAQRMVIAVF
jgi:hypothetical protein